MHPTRRLAVSLVLAATLCLSALGCSSSTKGGASGDFCTKLQAASAKLTDYAKNTCNINVSS